MLEAMKQNRQALRYVTSLHKTDREIPLEAMEESERPLEYAAPEHKRDRESMIESVKQNGYAYKYSAPKHKTDRQIMLESVNESENPLKHVTPVHKTDREIMLEVMKQNENSQKYATQEHKADRESVLEAEPDNLLDWANPLLCPGPGKPGRHRGGGLAVGSFQRKDGHKNDFSYSSLPGIFTHSAQICIRLARPIWQTHQYPPLECKVRLNVPVIVATSATIDAGIETSHTQATAWV